MFLSRVFKVFLVAIVAFVFASVTNAYAAANTVPTSKAGDGAGAVSGYTVTNVHYELNASNPANIDYVSFTLSAAATTVKIKLVAAGSTYYSCALVAGTWECDTTSPQATVLSVDELWVIATSD